MYLHLPWTWSLLFYFHFTSVILAHSGDQTCVATCHITGDRKRKSTWFSRSRCFCFSTKQRLLPFDRTSKKYRLHSTTQKLSNLCPNQKKIRICGLQCKVATRVQVYQMKSWIYAIPLICKYSRFYGHVLIFCISPCFIWHVMQHTTLNYSPMILADTKQNLRKQGPHRSMSVLVELVCSYQTNRDKDR